MAHAEREWAEAAVAPAERERAEDRTHGRHVPARRPLPFRSPSTLLPSFLDKTVLPHRLGRPYGMRRGLPWPTSRAGESPIRTHARHMFNRPPTLLTWSLNSSSVVPRQNGASSPSGSAVRHKTRAPVAHVACARNVDPLPRQTYVYPRPTPLT